ncbi:MAG: Uma2 family endonuclease [Kofleriaceae bacterium]
MRARYAGPGIGHVWLIDPTTRTIDVYRLVSGAYAHVTTSQGNARLRAEPFLAFDLDLSSVWSDTNE